MDILVVGSIALDSVKTPYGQTQESLGGSAIYFSASAGCFAPVRVVGVVGNDFDMDALSFLSERGVDLAGISVEAGRTFRWTGVYGDDMNTRETLETQLNVFADFRPDIPAQYRDSPCVFLANIQPELQLDVLRQVNHPALTVCDTMDLWIETRREALLELLAKVHVIILNDSEARQLTGEANLVKASKQVLDLGPRVAVVKKGEHGAWMLSQSNGPFTIPAFPTESVLDPTGAGDTFAGGFVGCLARAGQFSDDALRQAMAYGTVMASFSVEEFGVGRLRGLQATEIQSRFHALKRMTDFRRDLLPSS